MCTKTFVTFVCMCPSRNTLRCSHYAFLRPDATIQAEGRQLTEKFYTRKAVDFQASSMFEDAVSLWDPCVAYITTHSRPDGSYPLVPHDLENCPEHTGKEDTAIKFPWVCKECKSWHGEFYQTDEEVARCNDAGWSYRSCMFIKDFERIIENQSRTILERMGQMNDRVQGSPQFGHGGAASVADSYQGLQELQERLYAQQWQPMHVYAPPIQVYDEQGRQVHVHDSGNLSQQDHYSFHHANLHHHGNSHYTHQDQQHTAPHQAPLEPLHHNQSGSGQRQNRHHFEGHEQHVGAPEAPQESHGHQGHHHQGQQHTPGHRRLSSEDKRREWWLRNRSRVLASQHQHQHQQQSHDGKGQVFQGSDNNA